MQLFVHLAALPRLTAAALPTAARALALLLVLAAAGQAQDTSSVPARVVTPSDSAGMAARVALPPAAGPKTATVPTATSTTSSVVALPVRASAPTVATDSGKSVTKPSGTVGTVVDPALLASVAAANTGVDSATRPVNEFVQRAVGFYMQGKNELALSEYRRGIARDYSDSDTWFGLAELLHELGRDREAMEVYASALEAIEHAPELRLPYAELLVLTKRKADAVKVLRRGIEIDPDYSVEMKMMLGQILSGAMDDSTQLAESRAASPTSAAEAAQPAAKTAASGRTGRTARRRAARKKPLCKLFCPGTFEAIAPKPK